jgi:ABC-type amino acid transport substrate-binding protein
MPGPRRTLVPVLLAAGIVGAAAVLLIPRPESGSVPVGDPIAGRGSQLTHQEGVLAVEVRPVPPFAVPGPGGPAGFEIDLVDEVARRLSLRPDVAEAEGDPFASLLQGDADVVVAAARVTPKLEARVNLSEPYLVVRQAVVINIDVRPDVQSSADLTEGDEVAVVPGTTGEAWARSHLEPMAVGVVSYSTLGDAVVALSAGAVDAVVADEAAAMAQTSTREHLRVVETMATGEGMAMAIDPDNPALLEAVNDALGDMVADGTYDRLYDRYGDTLPLGGRITGP